MTEPTKESRDEAIKLLNEGVGYQVEPSSSFVTVLARTLDKLHNRTPVDPLLKEAREICAKWEDADDFPDNATAYRDGKRDSGLSITRTIEVLRRGMELAPEPRMPTMEEVRKVWATQDDFGKMEEALLDLFCKCCRERDHAVLDFSAAWHQPAKKEPT